MNFQPLAKRSNYPQTRFQSSRMIRRSPKTSRILDWGLNTGLGLLLNLVILKKGRGGIFSFLKITIVVFSSVQPDFPFSKFHFFVKYLFSFTIEKKEKRKKVKNTLLHTDLIKWNWKL